MLDTTRLLRNEHFYLLTYDSIDVNVSQVDYYRKIWLNDL